MVERVRCIAVVSVYTCIAQAVAGTPDLPFTTPMGPVGFQAHSYNDLRIWPQLLRKGARAIKIDPNFQASSFCAGQQRMRNGTDPRGCFILNHNNPDASSSRYDYNGTDDLLALLDDAAFVREARRPQRGAWLGSAAPSSFAATGSEAPRRPQQRGQDRCRRASHAQMAHQSQRQS